MLVYEGREYGSKAIVGVAYGYLDGRDAPKAVGFSGGWISRRPRFPVWRVGSQSR
jgi:hypothetical protein